MRGETAQQAAARAAEVVIDAIREPGRSPIVLWAVAWRPAAGGSWDILRDDGVPVIFEDRRFAERRSQVQAERFPDHLYQTLPMEGTAS